PAKDRLHVILDLEDETGGALRLRIDPDVEVHRAVERGLLTHQQAGQLGPERVAVFGGAEVALLLAPSSDRVDHAPNQLTDAGLAFGTGESAILLCAQRAA